METYNPADPDHRRDRLRRALFVADVQWFRHHPPDAVRLRRCFAGEAAIPDPAATLVFVTLDPRLDRLQLVRHYVTFDARDAA